MRNWCLTILLVFSVHTHASSEHEKVSDWRLQSPYTQGLIMSLSFGVYGSTPSALPVATEASVLSYYPLVAEHLIRHKSIPFQLGLLSGVALYWYFGYLLFRNWQIRRQESFNVERTP